MFLNKVFIIGNLTRDPEVKALPSGVKVCNLSLATNRTFKDKEGNKTETVEYHNVVAFGKLGELAGQYLKKGRMACVEGRLQTRSWDAQNNEKKYRTEIIAENIQFGPFPAGSSSTSSGSSASPATPEGSPAPSGSVSTDGKIEYPQEEINPDDIPF
jgi:single-strand DNA-binding protein